MYLSHMGDKLLEAARRRMFPDAAFEEQFKKGDILDEFFIEREYAIRLALPGDINALMEIEAQCWALPVQTDRTEIERRLTDPSCYTVVLEFEGNVIGVIYTQRIHKNDMKKMKAGTVHQFRVPTGSCIQFIALNIMPVYQDKGWGYELLEFVLQFFALHPDIHHAYAVTRCRDFLKSGCVTLQEYFTHIYRAGQLHDPILMFHQNHGARVLGLMDQYRPNDHENQGYGVLIEYEINNRPWLGKHSARVTVEKQQHSADLLLEFLHRKLNTADLDDRKSLKELGLDSLDFAETLIFMHEKLGMDITMRDLNNKSFQELQLLCEGGKDDQLVEKKREPLQKRMRGLMRQYPELVPLSLEGDGPCTFWIHPLSGDVGVYNTIAGQVDGAFRMIAVKARGFLSSVNEPLASVKEMAEYYCEMIMAAEPEGPYHLAGFSFGGTVAYEVARLLQTQGKAVKSLLLVESPCLSGRDSELFQTTYRNNLLMNANFLLLTLMNMEQPLSRRLPNGDVDWGFYQITADDVQGIRDEALVKHIVRFCKGKGLKQTDEELEFKLLSMSQVHISNLRALRQYQAAPLPRPNEILTRMFRTESASAVSRTIWNPDYLEHIQRDKGSMLPLLEGWNSVLPKLDTIILEGDNHFDILHSKESIRKFYDYCSGIFTGKPPVSQALVSSASNSSQQRDYPAIAIIGMSGRFPDAENVDEFWHNLKNGRNSIREVPDDRGWNMDDYYDPAPKTPGKTYSKWGGFLSDIDKFDPMFFKISPRDAELMDPSERLFLQESWKAIEDAGYNPGSLSGKLWGVFACAKGDYPIAIQNQIDSYYLPTDSYAATRLSYLLNLVGPAMSIDTACSSTLSVVVQACDSLAMGNCEAAVVGGGAVYATPNIWIGSSQSLLFSPDGQCYTFDERANGTVVAEAIGAVVLKRLDKAVEDHDHIYGVIRGWGMNQDGKTNGMTAPSGRAQSRLQTGIYEKFGINPENITMIEAHGTGTQLGDAVEYEALTESFRKYTAKTGYCALGSLKTNIGHAFFGSGIAGVIKILLSMKNGQIPPSLNYEKASPKMAVDSSPFFVNTALRSWEPGGNRLRCAAINAFGATGTNTHLVIEEYQPKANRLQPARPRYPVLFILSAKDEARLTGYIKQFIYVLEKNEYTDKDLADIAYTLQVGRESMEARFAVTVSSIHELKDKLRACTDGQFAGVGIYKNQAAMRRGARASLSTKETQEAMECWLHSGDGGKLLELWVQGYAIDWERLYSNDKPQRIPLPTYPFAKERCWIQSVQAEGRTKEINGQVSHGYSAPETDETIVSPVKQEAPYELMTFKEDWEEAPIHEAQGGELRTVVCFLSDPDNQSIMQRRNPGADVIFIAQGDEFRKKDDRNYIIAGRDKRTYEQLFRSIGADHKAITTVAFLWAYDDPAYIEDYRSIVYVLQAMASERVPAERLVLGAPFKTDLERCYLESWIGFERSLGPLVSKTRVKAVIQEAEPFHDSGITEQASDWLWREMGAIGKVHSALYQAGKRYELTINEVAAATGEPPFKTRGTYLITGGLGKLGLICARHLAQTYKARLILSGSSPLDVEKQLQIKDIETLGGRVVYIHADLCDKDRLRKGLEAAKGQFGDIQGIIHAAGRVDPQVIYHKPVDSFEKVIDPKIRGTLILDELTQGNPLDFVCYFSSSAAILGDFGACDYAVGNRFQMAYAHYKNKLEEQKEVLGRTVVVNWPLWRDGGMGLGRDDNEKYLQSSGQRYLETEEGIAVLEKILTQPHTQQLVMAGQKSAVYRFLRLDWTQTSKTLPDEPGNTGTTISNPVESQGMADISPLLEQDLKELISKLYRLPVEKLDRDEHLTEYGFDSINLFEFAGKMVGFFGVDITPSSLLGHFTIGKIVEYLLTDHQEAVEDFYKSKLIRHAASLPEADSDIEGGPSVITEADTPIIQDSREHMLEPIAIIGISGRFPQADSVEGLWENLRDRKECVTEVPENRWNWREIYGDPHQEAGKTYSKWGGFLTDIDRFDPLFFKISPMEAHIMDPCQRLFLQEAWHALEDAGYMGERIKGKSCGVYVGMEEGEYGFMARQRGHYYSNQNAVLSARIAYALDLKGPNLSITASCSSGLVALHHACQALRHNDCEMALAGGINLFVSPHVHIGMSMLDMLSPTGKSYVFDERADGMVPSEAVAVAVLKPLSKAIRDNDRIYGCITGSGVNHNGKGNGMMAPNPLRQAELIQDTLDKYGIDPLSIQYIISHSVGVQLGDAAEIDGLKKAFGKSSNGQRYCHIGSVKPLIGHTFAASGIVSLIAMLMAMKNETMLGLHHYEKSNENIDFTKTPFITGAGNQPWARQDNQPRRGAISTSANSGTNAFAVIEEYVASREERTSTEDAQQKRIFVFSAADHERLKAVVNQMYAYLLSDDEIPLSDLAYTLQTGREALACRLAIVAKSREELLRTMKGCADSTPGATGIPVFTGNTEDAYSDAQAPASSAGQLETIAEQWAKGGKVSWDAVFEVDRGRVLSLPVYPFKKDRYWLPAEPKKMIQDKKPVQEKEPVQADTGRPAREAAEKYIVHFFSEKLDIPVNEMKGKKHIQDYGVDSILIMKFIREVHKRFQVRISSRDIMQHPTISDLSTYLAHKLEESEPSGKVAEQDEYKDREVIEAMEKYIQGLIDFAEVEKRVGGVRI